MPEGNEDLYPSRTVSRASKQIREDPDLYGILVDLYEKSGQKDKAKRLRDVQNAAPFIDRNLTSGSFGKERYPSQDLLRAFLSSDKTIRREFAVQARKFLSERKAGRSVEEQRLRRGRAAQVVARSQRVQDASTGSPMLTSARGRASSILNQNLLGATGQLG